MLQTFLGNLKTVEISGLNVRVLHRSASISCGSGSGFRILKTNADSDNDPDLGLDF